MHIVLHSRDDVDRLYVSRKEGGRGLASVEESVDALIQQLLDYIKSLEYDWLLRIRTIQTTQASRKKDWKQKLAEIKVYALFKR